MKHLKSEKGFTLVELAIVMTIIGLLIGGILKGQELMENARVTSTIAQVRSYEAAVTTFRDTYSAMPGDMANANARLPNCGGSCNAGGGLTGDSLIGTVGDVTSNQATVASETVLFWSHLLLTNLISGVTSDPALNPGTAQIAWGESHPAARIGGGFHVKTGDGATALAFAASGIQPPGINLVLQNAVAADINGTAGVQVLSPLRAAQIDRKMDDGKSQTGYLQSYGAATCANGGTNADSYDESTASDDCGLFFRLQ
jgi:prepilin-type N-terminal cleavage/methylation domain-containing protein